MHVDDLRFNVGDDVFSYKYGEYGIITKKISLPFISLKINHQKRWISRSIYRIHLEDSGRYVWQRDRLVPSYWDSIVDDEVYWHMTPWRMLMSPNDKCYANYKGIDKDLTTKDIRMMISAGEGWFDSSIEPHIVVYIFNGSTIVKRIGISMLRPAYWQKARLSDTFTKTEYTEFIQHINWQLMIEGWNHDNDKYGKHFKSYYPISSSNVMPDYSLLEGLK